MRNQKNILLQQIHCWTQQEDQILVQAIQKYGISNWKTVKQLLPYKSVNQCAQRFNSMQPQINLKKLKRLLKENDYDIIIVSKLMQVSIEALDAIVETAHSNILQANAIDQQKMQQEVNGRLTGLTSKFARKHKTNVEMEQKMINKPYVGDYNNIIHDAIDQLQRQCSKTMNQSDE